MKHPVYAYTYIGLFKSSTIFLLLNMEFCKYNYTIVIVFMFCYIVRFQPNLNILPRT
jgi:hypothetical protein